MPGKRDKGRGFDMWENLTWAQRIDKEERCVLREDVGGSESGQKSAGRRSESSLRGAGEEMLRGHKQRRSRRDKSGQMQRSQSWAGSSLQNVPSELQAISRIPVVDSCLMTLRQPMGSTHVTKLRFIPEIVMAPWIPGIGKYVAYKPEFYTSQPAWAPKSLLQPGKPEMKDAASGTGQFSMGAASRGSRGQGSDPLPAAENTGASWATSRITEGSQPPKAVAESADVMPQ